MWCIPPEQNADFVCAMENVLEVYKRPYDPKHPVVCMDEKPKQLVMETRAPIACGPGRVECFDFEYERNGTAIRRSSPSRALDSICSRPTSLSPAPVLPFTVRIRSCVMPS